MPVILSIETAVSVCSVAVHKDGSLQGLIELHQANVHGQKLVPLIKDLLTQLGIKGQELDAVAVSKGPGSYTGLRIGVSTAKGLAFAHGLPLIGVDTLDALARNVKEILHAGEFVVPMMDARRMEVYCKVYDSDLKIVSPLSAHILSGDSFSDFLEGGRVYFLGNANPKTSALIVHPNACFLDLVNTASSVGEIAAGKFEKGEFEDLAYFEPNYLKDFMVIKSKKNPLLS
ncbi:tRNA (adenosine(37)-N6)-threonylcarbamoyltransferase complex dimerization subunit type 1 TsaB [Negadavirga shengliensis]|uniref:tRNA (Adenosine(37)-N6)-threonylcarbamoyltransferase complex dimerization subunit type 1 TsaB n=1 Tax=Negadavirga shengliensis TaxID=1389218 RepID=A0ABV9SWA1_9BACT